MALTFSVPATSSPSPGVQLSYPLTMGIGHEGMLADLQSYVSRSYVNDSGLPLAFGTLVSLNQAPTAQSEFSITVVDKATDKIVGMNIDSNTFEGATGSAYQARPGYYPGTSILADGRIGTPDSQTANVVSVGNVLVWTTDVLTTSGDPVRFYIDDASASIPGAFQGRWCTAPVAGKTVLITEGARWVTKSINNLVQLDFDILASKFVAD